MKVSLHTAILKYAHGIELGIALSILAAASFGFFSLLWDAGHAVFTAPASFSITSFLSKALLVVMGVEFVRMLVLHTTKAVIDVLLFAIARQMIVSHADSTQTLLGVAAVAGIFAIKKFLYVQEAPSPGKF